MNFKEIKAELTTEVKVLEAEAERLRSEGQAAIQWADHLDQEAWDLQVKTLKRLGYKFKWLDDGDSLEVRFKGKVIESCGQWAGFESHVMFKALQHARLV